MKAKKSKKNTVKAYTLKQVLHYVKSYRLLLALSIIFSTVSVALTLYIPIIIGKAIDLIIGKDNVMLDAVLELLVSINTSVPSIVTIPVKN